MWQHVIQFIYIIFITNNHASFHLWKNKVWSNIRNSQNIMTVIVVTSYYSLVTSHCCCTSYCCYLVASDWSLHIYQLPQIICEIKFMSYQNLSLGQLFLNEFTNNKIIPNTDFTKTLNNFNSIHMASIRTVSTEKVQPKKSLKVTRFFSLLTPL